jgi:DNA primase
MDVTEEIRGIARSFLKNVRPSGPENIMAICPFHRKPDGSEESTPSFSMSITKGVYYCHQCHEKGGLRRFLREMGVDPSAIALHYGTIIEGAASNSPVIHERTRVCSIFNAEPIEESMLGLFAGYDVTPYLHGFTKDTLDHFGVCWDGWYHRIIFPIRNIVGELVALSGRAIYKEQKPRYKIYDKEYLCWQYPARETWRKNTTLWHGDDVYPRLLHRMAGDRAESVVFVVEGFKAAMWLWQCGYKNVVALLGSYMSWEHEWMLVSLGCTVYLMLDNGDAGVLGQQDAAKRLACGPNPVPVRMVQYPARLAEDVDAQPDSLTCDELNEMVASAPLYENWLLAR